MAHRVRARLEPLPLRPCLPVMGCGSQATQASGGNGIRKEARQLRGGEAPYRPRPPRVINSAFCANPPISSRGRAGLARCARSKAVFVRR